MRRFLILGLVLLATACVPPSAKAPHYVVFFEEWSSKIDPPAETTIREAAAWAKAHPLQAVQVRGYADPVGTPAANKGISALRAKMVSDTLVADGVAAARVSLIAEGAVTFAEDSQESRRVEIVFTGP